MKDLNKIHQWFPTLIYCDFLEDKKLIEYLRNKALELRIQYTVNNNDWRCNTFSTLNHYNYIIDSDDTVFQIIELCKQRVYEYAAVYGIQENYTNLKCTDFWFNVADHGSYQEYHQHTNSHFSLSYYIDVCENSGNIVFKSFESMFDMYPLPITSKDLNAASFKSCSYKPKNGMLLIFRSNLLHMVERNEENASRISISMNFSFEH